jgi:hypothetical protein
MTPKAAQDLVPYSQGKGMRTLTEGEGSCGRLPKLLLYLRLATLADLAVESNVPQLAEAVVEEVYIEL